MQSQPQSPTAWFATTAGLRSGGTWVATLYIRRMREWRLFGEFGPTSYDRSRGILAVGPLHGMSPNHVVEEVATIISGADGSWPCCLAGQSGTSRIF